MKVFDMVETSMMSAEYDGSLVVGDCIAQENLENGRLAVVDEVKKTIRYAQDATEEVLLLAGVEKLYNDEGLTSYCAEKGKPAIGLRMKKGNRFKTTAVADDLKNESGKITGLKKGDLVTAGKEGKFVKLEFEEGTETFIAEVLDITVMYHDLTPAIKVRVKKA